MARKTQTAAPATEPQPVPLVSTPSQLDTADQAELTDAKVKLDAAREAANHAGMALQIAQLTHDNLVLRLAVKYQLSQGDQIGTDGTLTRNQH